MKDYPVPGQSYVLAAQALMRRIVRTGSGGAVPQANRLQELT